MSISLCCAFYKKVEHQLPSSAQSRISSLSRACPKHTLAVTDVALGALILLAGLIMMLKYPSAFHKIGGTTLLVVGSLNIGGGFLKAILGPKTLVENLDEARKETQQLILETSATIIETTDAPLTQEEVKLLQETTAYTTKLTTQSTYRQPQNNTGWFSRLW